MATLDTHPHPDSGAIWTTAIKGLFDRYAAVRAKRRAAAELRSLDPQTLKDLAIDPTEFDSILYSGRQDRTRNYTGA